MRCWVPGHDDRWSGMMMAPLAIAYAGILAVRSVWWERYARMPPLPTVSVGNLTIGGNGKTPFTLFLAGRLRQRGVVAGIVSRGYGGHLSRRARLVSDGRHIMMTPDEVGDEPVMMAKSFEGPVAVARRRIDAIELLARKELADVVVLDDGFQHLRLRRDVDLLLVNRSIGVGNGRLLPAGPLREPMEAMQRADALVEVEAFGAANRSIRFSAGDIVRGKPILRAQLKPSSLIYSEDGYWREGPLRLEGRRVVAVSGIANCGGFRAMIDALGANLVHALDYPDHHEYGPGDWKKIAAAARKAEMVITTEKDLVKLESFTNPQVPLSALRLNVALEPEDENQLLKLTMEGIGRPDLVGGTHLSATSGRD
jgi:tetraacyldisaccharide 4'-kinase